MAKADYALCEVCGKKAWYDADISDPRYPFGYESYADPSETGNAAALCVEHSRTHQLIAVPKSEKE